MLEIFDGHNGAVNYMLEYKPGGRDFMERASEGHLDLPRARAGGMIGGLLANGTTIPEAVGDASGLQHVFAVLRACGFDDAALRKIGHENWFRVLRCSIG